MALSLRKVSYLTVSELMSDPQARLGQNVNVVGVVEYESLEVTPDMKVFELTDENNGNFKVRAEYNRQPSLQPCRRKKGEYRRNYGFWIYV